MPFAWSTPTTSSIQWSLYWKAARILPNFSSSKSNEQKVIVRPNFIANLWPCLIKRIDSNGFALELAKLVTEEPKEEDLPSRKFRLPFNAHRVLSAAPPILVGQFLPDDPTDQSMAEEQIGYHSITNETSKEKSIQTELPIINPNHNSTNSNIPHLNSTPVESTPNVLPIKPPLAQLLDFFSAPPRVNSLLSSYTTSSLIALIESRPTSGYLTILSTPSLLPNLLQHSYDPSVSGLILKIFLRRDFLPSNTSLNSNSLDSLSITALRGMLSCLVPNHPCAVQIASTLAASIEDLLTQPSLRPILLDRATFTALSDLTTSTFIACHPSDSLLIDSVTRLLTSLVAADPSISRQVLSPLFACLAAEGRRGPLRARLALLRLLASAADIGGVDSVAQASVTAELLSTAAKAGDFEWRSLFEIFSLELKCGDSTRRQRLTTRLANFFIELAERKSGRPNWQFASDLLAVARTEAGDSPCAELAKAEAAVAALKADDRGYPQPETEDLNFSEVIGEMQKGDFDDGVLTTLNLAQAQGDEVGGAEEFGDGLAKSVELLEFAFDKEVLRGSMASNDDCSDSVVTEYGAGSPQRTSDSHKKENESD